MAGKIIADQIEGTTTTETVGGASVTIPNVIDTKYVVNGSAKAWSHSGLDDNVIEDSLNTSALSDEGTGLVNYSFVSSFNSANHVDVAMIGNNAAHVFYNGGNAKAAGSTGTIRLYNTNNAHTDANTINVLSHGDLA